VGFVVAGGSGLATHDEDGDVDEDGVVDDTVLMPSSSAPRAFVSGASASRFNVTSTMPTSAAISSRNMRRASTSYAGLTSKQLPPSSLSTGSSLSSPSVHVSDSEFSSNLIVSDSRFSDQEFILQQQLTQPRRNSDFLHQVAGHHTSSEADPGVTYSLRPSNQEDEAMEPSSDRGRSSDRRATFSGKSTDGQQGNR